VVICSSALIVGQDSKSFNDSVVHFLAPGQSIFRMVLSSEISEGVKNQGSVGLRVDLQYFVEIRIVGRHLGVGKTNRFKMAHEWEEENAG